MTSKSANRNRNIVIAVVMIAVIAVAGLFAGGVFTGDKSPLSPPFDFALNISPSSGTIMQGRNLQTTVNISLLSGSPEQVTLNVDGLNGVTYIFSPQTGTPDCTSTLTINVSESVPTKIYSLTVTATGGGKTYSNTYTLSVLSAYVNIYGKVTTTDPGKVPTSIKCVDVSSGQTFENIVLDNSYGINLPNQHTYRVTFGWGAGEIWSIGTFDGGTLTVNEGVGTVSMRKNIVGSP
jgi:hypothetical protein